MSPSALDATGPPPLRARIVMLAYELLLSATTSFLLTLALLPLFDLHRAPLLVLRVTGLFTVAVFIALDVVFQIVWSHRSNNIPNNGPESLRKCTAGDAEAGWPPEKVEGTGCTAGL